MKALFLTIALTLTLNMAAQEKVSTLLPRPITEGFNNYLKDISLSGDNVNQEDEKKNDAQTHSNNEDNMIICLLSFITPVKVQPKPISEVFQEYLRGEGLFTNAFFKPTIFMENNYPLLPLGEQSAFFHTLRGAVYTNDFLTYMPR